MIRLLTRSIGALPPRLRHLLGSTRLARYVLNELLGSRRMVRRTPEGHDLRLHPILHAELLSLADLADYEPELRRTITAVVRPGMMAFDVGANVGIFTSLLSSLVGAEGRVVAFEPEETNAACLDESIRQVPLPNVSLERRAVGRATGSAQFDHRGGAFSGRLVGSGGYAVTRNVTPIEVVSLDDYTAGGGPAPDVVKIDVEGNEMMVLEGMERLLAEHPPILVCEVHAHLGDSPQAVIDHLHRRGYEILDPESVSAGTPRRIRQLESRGWFLARPAARTD